MEKDNEPDKDIVWDKLTKKYLTPEEKVELIRAYNQCNVDQAIIDAMVQFLRDQSK